MGGGQGHSKFTWSNGPDARPHAHRRALPPSGLRPRYAVALTTSQQLVIYRESDGAAQMAPRVPRTLPAEHAGRTPRLRPWPVRTPGRRGIRRNPRRHALSGAHAFGETRARRSRMRSVGSRAAAQIFPSDGPGNARPRRTAAGLASFQEVGRLNRLSATCGESGAGGAMGTRAVSARRSRLACDRPSGRGDAAS